MDFSYLLAISKSLGIKAQGPKILKCLSVLNNFYFNLLFCLLFHQGFTNLSYCFLWIQIGTSSCSLSTSNDVSTILQSSLKKWQFVGHGAFSVVFSAYHNGTKIAVKLLQAEKLGSEHEETFFKEVELMR